MGTEEVGTEEQRNRGHKGTVGTEEQEAKRKSRHRGTVGTEEQWAQRNRGIKFEKYKPRKPGNVLLFCFYFLFIPSSRATFSTLLFDVHFY